MNAFKTVQETCTFISHWEQGSLKYCALHVPECVCTCSQTSVQEVPLSSICSLLGNWITEFLKRKASDP